MNIKLELKFICWLQIGIEYKLSSSTYLIFPYFIGNQYKMLTIVIIYFIIIAQELKLLILK